ncbi:MAG: hypothetical protein ABUL66_03840, partial [Verrucomicrobiota bacterium]
MKIPWRKICICALLMILVFVVFEIQHSLEPHYKDHPLRQWLHNEKVLGTKQLTLNELLTVKQIVTGKEPDIATFEVPISYDAVTNIGELRLLMDAGTEQWPARGAEFQECDRATNGDCLLAWNTTFDPPGAHTVQAQLVWTENWRTFEIKGPTAFFYSTNVCQFDPVWSDFDYSDFAST